MTVDPAWEKVHSSREWGKYPPEELVRFVATRYYARADRRTIGILDLGCGLGSGLWFVVREGFRGAGIDGSPSAIARLRERLAREGLEAELHVGDLNIDIPKLFNPESFDAILDITSLYCLRLQDARRAVADAARLLKPGGRLFSMTFDVATWGYGEGRQIEPNAFTDVPDGPFKDRGLVRFYARPELDELYAALSIVAIESTTRTMDNGRRVVKHWVTECLKRDA